MTEAAGRWARLRGWLARAWRRIHPEPRARRGAARGAVGFLALAVVVMAWGVPLGLGPVLNPIAGIAILGGIAAGVGLGIAAAAKLTEVVPRFISLTGIAAVGVFALLARMFYMFAAPRLALLLGAGLALAHCAAGAAIASALRGGFARAALARRVLLIAVPVLALGVDGLVIAWLASDGSRDHLTARAVDPVAVEPLAASDPSSPGRFAVRTLTYGSGTDARRPEFGEEADLLTEPVDASPFVKGTPGWRARLRELFWGFDFEHFPLNGRVWYPEGDGPFPLVLVVHGNHFMGEFSDPGYAYLGELLASRGFITVSVDENFLNGGITGGLSRESDGRAWMLLKHLEQWRDWSRTEGHVFFGGVDLDAVGLIGHSRGGEAAYVAGAFNRLAHYPDDANQAFEFDFGVRAIVAIAPADGQYQPAGQLTPLEDVSYLVLQGGHDSDVSGFMGARQYQRLSLTEPDRFKASVYAYRANHGQFNTVWGRTDLGWPTSRALNLAPLLAPEDQRRIGALYISAFLEATLHGDRAYVALFRDHRRAGDWLPDDVYVTRYEDASFRPVSDYEEDVDVASATLPGAAIDARGFALWREEDLPFRNPDWGSFENNVVVLGWRVGEDAGESPSYAISLPEPAGVDADSLLVFSLAELDEEIPAEDDADADDPEEDADDASDEERDTEPLVVDIELETSSGSASRLPLSRFRPVPPIIESRFTKLWDESNGYRATEAVLQTFELPLAAFAEQPGFEPADVAVVRFVFQRGSRERVVALDRVGFADGT